MNESKRLIWLDYARVTASFLVILEHLNSGDDLITFIRSFAMPFFFFVSGFFVKEIPNDVKGFIKVRFKSLIVPYFVFGLLSYLFWVIIKVNRPESVIHSFPYWRPLLGLIYGVGYDNYLVQNIALWFLPTLFCISLFFVVVIQFKRKILTSLIIFLFGLGYQQVFNEVKLPWGMEIAAICQIFFVAGFYFRKNNYFKHLISLHLVFRILLFFTLFFSIWFLSKYNSSTSVIVNYYGNSFFIFSATSILGILLLFNWGSILASVFGYFRLVEFISQNAITIFALHFYGYIVPRFITRNVFELEPSIWDNNLIINILVALSVLLTLCIPAYFIRKKVPYILGK